MISYHYGWVGGFFGIVDGDDAEEFAVEHFDDVATDLIGVAIGVKFGLDVRAFGPFPEFLVFGFGGVAEFKLDPFLLYYRQEGYGTACGRCVE